MKTFSLRTWICILQSSLNNKEGKTNLLLFIPLIFKKKYNTVGKKFEYLKTNIHLSLQHF